MGPGCFPSSQSIQNSVPGNNAHFTAVKLSFNKRVKSALEAAALVNLGTRRRIVPN